MPSEDGPRDAPRPRTMLPTPNEVAAKEAAGLRAVDCGDGQITWVHEDCTITIGGVAIPAKVARRLNVDG